MNAIAVDPARAELLLTVEAADAWGEYLDSCRRTTDRVRYEDLEIWAWARLQSRLRVIGARKAALRPRRHVLDDDISLPDIAVAESVGGDWCSWTPIAPRPGCRLETTVAVALGICEASGDLTVSGLNW